MNDVAIGHLRKLYWRVYWCEINTDRLIDWACDALEYLDMPNDTIIGLAMSSDAEEAWQYAKKLLIGHFGAEEANQPILPLMKNYRSFDGFELDRPLGDSEENWEFQNHTMLVYVPKKLDLDSEIVRCDVRRLLDFFYESIPSIIDQAIEMYRQTAPCITHFMKIRGLDEVFPLIYSVELNASLNQCISHIGIDPFMQFDELPEKIGFFKIAINVPTQ